MAHPFAAARVTTENLSGASSTTELPNSRSKTIGELGGLPPDLANYVKELMLPTELQNAEALAAYGKMKANFRISIGDLINAITKSDLGLDKVDNTSDAEKPVSNPVQEALNKKLDSTYKPSVTDIEGLDEVLEDFFNKEIGVEMSDVKGLVDALKDKANKQHSHAIGEVNGLVDALGQKANANHSHDLTSLNGWIDFLRDLNNTLNTFATKAEVNNMLDEKALVVGEFDWS